MRRPSLSDPFVCCLELVSVGRWHAGSATPTGRPVAETITAATRTPRRRSTPTTEFIRVSCNAFSIWSRVPSLTRKVSPFRGHARRQQVCIRVLHRRQQLPPTYAAAAAAARDRRRALRSTKAAEPHVRRPQFVRNPVGMMSPNTSYVPSNNVRVPQDRIH